MSKDVNQIVNEVDSKLAKLDEDIRILSNLISYLSDRSKISPEAYFYLEIISHVVNSLKCCDIEMYRLKAAHVAYPNSSLSDLSNKLFG